MISVLSSLLVDKEGSQQVEDSTLHHPHPVAQHWPQKEWLPDLLKASVHSPQRPLFVHCRNLCLPSFAGSVSLSPLCSLLHRNYHCEDPPS